MLGFKKHKVQQAHLMNSGLGVRELWIESRLQCVETGMAQYVETTVSEGWTVK